MHALNWLRQHSGPRPVHAPPAMRRCEKTLARIDQGEERDLFGSGRSARSSPRFEAGPPLQNYDRQWRLRSVVDNCPRCSGSGEQLGHRLGVIIKRHDVDDLAVLYRPDGGNGE